MSDPAARADALRPTDPQQLGPYRLLGVLGQGGMGTVYLGQTGDGPYVAVKMLRRDISATTEFRNRFRSEVNRAREVPPFCTAEVIDADPDHEYPYLVTEYVDGPSLAQVVDRHGPLSPGNLQGVAIGVATALVAIHGAGVIHRDLKPENVLLPPGNPKVIDFGIARALEITSKHTGTDQMVGTVAYMAPERFDDNRRDITPAADVFAWAAVIAYAGTGRTPFSADSPAATAARILTQPPDLDGLTGPLRDLVAAALTKQPEERPSARDLLDALLAMAGEATPGVITAQRALSPSSDATTVRGRPAGRPRWVLPAILAAALVALIAIAVPTVARLVGDGPSPASPAAASGGELVRWGADTMPFLTPARVGADRTWREVSTGVVHTCALRTDDSLWCWGGTGRGELGIGVTSDQVYGPARVNGEWATVSAGWHSTCGIRTDGTLWCWGGNNAGQLGIGSTDRRDRPARVGGESDWRSVSMGHGFACGIRGADELFCWGGNDFGRLGQDDDRQRSEPTRIGGEWRGVAAGTTGACGTRLDGSLWCWGDNAHGQLGQDGIGGSRTPVRSGQDGGWDTVGVGDRYACALRTGGELWCWGFNGDGRLGLGDTGDRRTPERVGGDATWTRTAVGFDHSCATRADESLWCWGENGRGDVGSGDLGSKSSPVPVGQGGSWAAPAAGETHSCATRTDGTLWCWGYDIDQQLGAILPAVTPVPAEGPWTAIGAGRLSVCGIAADSALWCGYYNGQGQLGVGDNVPRTELTRVGTEIGWTAVSGGRYHTCGLRGAELWCWGDGDTGMLGAGDTTDRHRPVAVPGEWAQVVAADGYTCAIRADGSLWCWGDNARGQLGSGNTTASPVPVAAGPGTWSAVSARGGSTCAVRTEGTLWCWGAVSGQISPTQVGTLAAWRSVAVGQNFVCGTRVDGTLWCWGDNAQGRLGLGTADARPAPARVGTADDWEQISAGQGHACGVRSGGSVWCWGANGAGQLGQGGTTDRSEPTQVPGLTARLVTTGWYGTYAITR